MDSLQKCIREFLLSVFRKDAAEQEITYLNHHLVRSEKVTI